MSNKEHLVSKEEKQEERNEVLYPRITSNSTSIPKCYQVVLSVRDGPGDEDSGISLSRARDGESDGFIVTLITSHDSLRLASTTRSICQCTKLLRVAIRRNVLSAMKYKRILAEQEEQEQEMHTRKKLEDVGVQLQEPRLPQTL
jgi:hypothetical protein